MLVAIVSLSPCCLVCCNNSNKNNNNSHVSKERYISIFDLKSAMFGYYSALKHK